VNRTPLSASPASFQKIHLSGRALCLAAVLSWTAAAALALDDYSKGILDLNAVWKAAAEVTRDKYPNADDVLVDDHILNQYEPDGRAVTWDDTFVKVLTEKGKEDNQTLTLYFTLPYSTAAFKLVQVIKPDGAVVAVDVEKQSRVMVDRSQMSSNIYDPNDKILSVGVPDLEVGDMVRYVALKELVKPRVPNTWSEYEVLEYTSPMKHYLYEVLAPKALPLRSIALKSEVKGTVTYTAEEQGDRVRHRWEVRDVPRMYEEPNMPALHTVVQRLLVSTIPDWEYVSKWYWNLSEPHFKDTPAMRAKVEELTKGLQDRDAKLRAVFKFVSQEVRYMGITVEKEAPGYEPHDVQLTFDNRHGVCRDKAALLVAMLRLAGFKAFPVLIHAGPKKDEEVPQPYFNHAISAVENDGGAYALMDSTDENTRDLFPAYLCNTSYLVARPEGDTLRTAPIVPAEENLMRIETEATLDASGNLAGESVLHFDGINDNAYRGYFSRIKPEERRRYFEGALKRFAAGTRLTALDIQPADMMDTDTPLTIRIRYEAEDILVADKATIMLPVPRLGTRVGMVNFILGKTGLEKREYPLKTDFACGVRESLKLTLDPSLGEVEAMPVYPALKTDTLSWQRHLRREGNALLGDSEFLIAGVEFNPQQYLQLKQTLKAMEINDRKMPILQRGAKAGTSDADAVVLEDTWEYEVKDAHNWTEKRTLRKQILTYNGKKDNAEWKWDYNPAWEETKVLKATVTNGNETKSISEQEQNLMDSDWVAAAPRYPAGKTLVASLPGVEIGSVVEVQVVRTYRDQPFFWMRQSFRDSDPIQKMTVRVKAPRSLRLAVGRQDAGFGGAGQPAGAPVLSGKQTSAGDQVVYEWTAQDLPAIKPEENLPPPWSFTPTVWVSAGRWDAYAKTVRDALLEATRGQKAAEKEAAALARGRKPKELVTAIRDHVAKRIRSAGPGLDDLPLTAVTAADRTYAEGYGNSADQAVLLYAMLTKAGLKPEFVLASQWSVVKALAPPLAQYARRPLLPTVLVRVNVDGKPVYLNDTDQYAALGATGFDGCLGLSLGTGKTETITAPAERREQREVSYDVEVAANGNARITKTVRYRGDAFGQKHKEFAEMPPEERHRYYQEVVARLSQSARAEGDLKTDFTTYPGVETFTAIVEDFALREGEYLYFELPESLSNVLGLRADERSNDLYWSDPTRSSLTTTVHLPAGVVELVLAPESVTWTAPSKAGKITVSRQELKATATGGSEPGFVLTHEVALQPAVLKAGDYGELLEIDRRLSHTRARTVLVRMKGK
jgi:transglutaminase-like putative cysteine protease